MDLTVKRIASSETYDWLLYKHYAKRIPSISYAFGLFDGLLLIGVCTIGKPPSPALCVGVCGKENSCYVYELNRLCVNEGLERNSLSFFVGGLLKLLPDMILVSYADTSKAHNGYIYQATNWLYTGLTIKRREWRERDSNKHSKSISVRYSHQQLVSDDRFHYVERPQNHRYIYLVGNRRFKKMTLKKLNYKQLDYPKGENSRYDSSHSAKIQLRLF